MTLLAEVAHLASGHDYPYRDVFIRVTDELVRLQTELTETRDLAEHWAILAEQRRVELGECRKDAERYQVLFTKEERMPDYNPFAGLVRRCLTS